MWADLHHSYRSVKISTKSPILMSGLSHHTTSTTRLEYTSLTIHCHSMATGSNQHQTLYTTSCGIQPPTLFDGGWLKNAWTISRDRQEIVRLQIILLHDWLQLYRWTVTHVHFRPHFLQHGYHLGEEYSRTNYTAACTRTSLGLEENYMNGHN